jgi:PAS domain S-box-containing protein
VKSQEELLQEIHKLKMEVAKLEDQKHDELFKKLYEDSDDAFLIISGNKFIDCNDAAYKMLGYKNKNKLLSKHPWEISPEFQYDGISSKEKARILFGEIYKNGYKRFEWIHKKADGTEFYVDVSLSAIKLDNKMVLYVVWRDIDKQKKLYNEFVKNQNLLKSFLDNTSSVVYIKDAEERYILVNKEFESLFSEETEIIGKTDYELFPKEMADLFVENDKKALEEGKRIEMEDEVLIPKDNKFRHYLSSKFPLHDADGNIYAVCGLSTDISDRLKTEELKKQKTEAEEANKAKSEFIANMSHEIRTPMNAILGFTEIILNSSLNEQQRKALNVVKDSGQALMQLINDVLDISKIESGRLEIKKSSFSFRESIDTGLKGFYHSAKSKGLDFSCNISPEIPENLIGDPLRLRQILVNIVGNAIKFTEKGGVYIDIDLESKTDDSTIIRFCVKDTGVGVNKEKQKVIFDAFMQADGSTTRHYGGTGLGLTICSRLLDMMNGKIWLESQNEAGSNFFFSIPFSINKNVELLEDAVPDKKKKTKTLNVLVVEDNHENQQLVLTYLEESGHTADLAENGMEAIEKIKDGKHDAILMDIQMPFMNGYDAARKIREIEKKTSKHIPIIAMTAYALPEERKMCFNSGMDDYLAKPVTVKQVLEKLDKWT